MKVEGGIAVAAMKSPTEEPTLESTWHAAAGSPITDEVLEWPADLFALTNVILERSEVYRFALSPPAGAEWPPSRFPSWSEAVEEAGRQWSAWVESRQGEVPDLLAEQWRVFRERAVTDYFDVAVHQVRTSSASSQSSHSQCVTPVPRVLELDELTILTGWAQALAEALTYAPERVVDD